MLEHRSDHPGNVSTTYFVRIAARETPSRPGIATS